jgi:hypothetical protein
MIICPNCAAENRDASTVCYFCGQDLDGEAEEANPTQPVRVRPAAPLPYDTQPVNPPPGSSGYPPNAQIYTDSASASTQPYPPQQSYRYGQGQTQAAQTQPGAQSYPTQPYPPGGPPPGGLPPAGVSAVPPKRNFERFWPLLVISLGVVFLCVGALVIYTFTALIGGGTTRFGQQVSTQVAEILPLPGDPSPTPEEPTPWPTLTPLPTATLAPTETQIPSPTPEPPTPIPPTPVPPTPIPPTPVPPDAQPTLAPGVEPTLNPTQVVDLERLLSPECASALDVLSDLGGQVTSRPTAPFDANWRRSLSAAVAEVNTHCGTLEDASPVPGIVAEAQQELSLATSEFDTATRLFNEGVREWNIGKILDAGRHAREATGHLNNAIAALGRVTR